MENETAILRNIQTDAIYRHIEGDRYKNLTTGTEGEIAPELAEKVLRINVNASFLFNKYPNIEKLVTALKLKIEP